MFNRAAIEEAFTTALGNLPETRDMDADAALHLLLTHDTLYENGGPRAVEALQAIGCVGSHEEAMQLTRELRALVEELLDDA